jgi:hypothetical protein
MSTQRDFAKEWKEALTEYENAKEAYFDLSGTVTSHFAAAYHGQQNANPPLNLLNAATVAKGRWEAAKNRLREIAVEWAKV